MNFDLEITPIENEKRDLLYKAEVKGLDGLRSLQVLDEWKREYGYGYRACERLEKAINQQKNVWTAVVDEFFSQEKNVPYLHYGFNVENVKYAKKGIISHACAKLLKIQSSFESWVSNERENEIRPLVNLCMHYMSNKDNASFAECFNQLKAVVSKFFGEMDYQSSYSDFVFKFSDEDDWTPYAKEFFNWLAGVVEFSREDPYAPIYDFYFNLNEAYFSHRRDTDKREREYSRLHKKSLSELTTAERQKRRVAAYNHYERNEVYDKDGTCTGYEERI